MRIAVSILLLACASVNTAARQRDAAAVLADMRQALGGDAALDVIRTLSFNGIRHRMIAGRGRPVSEEVFLMLPDHYLRIERDYDSSGPRPLDITYYNGLRGHVPIRRTDANIAFPPEPGPNTPEALAERQRLRVLSAKQEVARLGLVLFGRSLSLYPLDFEYVGATQQDGRSYEVIDARAADGFVMRLAVDAVTDLPAVLSWAGPAEFMTTSTSTVVTKKGGEVVSQSAPQFTPAPNAQPGTTIRKLEISDFKRQDNVNWPRRLKESSPQAVFELRVSRYRINPQLDARKFDIK